MSDFLYYITETVKGIRWVDIIDIIIVSFFLYYIFKFIQDRRAGKLAVGLILLLALLFLSEALQMRALNFILSNLFSVGIIALVIVFQPELRSVLEKVGAESIRSIRGKMDDETIKRYEECIEEVVVATEQLSLSKTGALMVFERGTKLGDVIRTGTVIDAKAASQLICNVFFNKSPLHDGAAVFREGKLYAAGCFLPLSENGDITKELGTRHRAGIGVSETSDAIVLIVSEETGVISVASDGVLQRGFARKKLEEYLKDKLIVKENLIKNKVKRGFARIGKKKKGEEADNGTKK